LLAFVREFSRILRTAFSNAIPQNSHCITPVALFSLTASSDLLDSLSDIGLDASEEVVDSSHFSGNRQRTYLDKDFLISSDLVEDRAAEVSGKEEDCNDDGGGARVLTDTSKEGKEGTERGREGADVDAESQNDRERAREGDGTAADEGEHEGQVSSAEGGVADMIVEGSAEMKEDKGRTETVKVLPTEACSLTTTLTPRQAGSPDESGAGACAVEAESQKVDGNKKEEDEEVNTAKLSADAEYFAAVAIQSLVRGAQARRANQHLKEEQRPNSAEMLLQRLRAGQLSGAQAMDIYSRRPSAVVEKLRRRRQNQAPGSQPELE
jgi:hypothetical protein